MSHPRWQVRRIVEMSASELDLATSNCALAFEPLPPAEERFVMTDSAIGSLARSNWPLCLAFWKFHIEAGLIDGEVYAVGDDFKGMAIVFGPGKDFLVGKKQEEARVWENFYEKIPQVAKDWWDSEFLPKWAALDAQVFPLQDQKLGVYHILVLYTHPDAQRQGIASDLVAEVFQKADKEGVITMLETTTDLDIRIYKKLGFEVAGSTFIKGSPGFDDYTVTAMIHRAKSAS